MLLNKGAENIELAAEFFHTGSEGVDKSECCQLGNALWETLLNWRSGRAGGDWLDGLRGGQPQAAGAVLAGAVFLPGSSKVRGRTPTAFHHSAQQPCWALPWVIAATISLNSERVEARLN